MLSALAALLTGCSVFYSNLWLPWAIHFAWNLLLGPVLGLTVSGTEEAGLGWSLFAIEGPALFTGGAFGLEGGLVVTATTVILVVGLARSRELAMFLRPPGEAAGSGEQR